jgi:predicted Zn finger-like uncharacterized protein
MKINCAGCRKDYDLAFDDIRRLPNHILNCSECGKSIKIAACPNCRSLYSITFSKTSVERYSLNCAKCSTSFFIHFPQSIEPSTEPSQPKTDQKKDNSTRIESMHKLPLTNRFENRVYNKKSDAAFSTKHISNLFLKAIDPKRLAIAWIGSMLMIISLMAWNYLSSFIPGSKLLPQFSSIASIGMLVPFGISLFFYTIVSAEISDVSSIRQMKGQSSPSANNSAGFTRFIVPSMVSNLIFFAILEGVLALFGAMPVVGPLIFALLFLPMYAVSLIMIVFFAIGFWFLPPILASQNKKKAGHLSYLLNFIKKHNFSLIFMIPLMFFITALTGLFIYILHYGAISFSLMIAGKLMPEENLKVFSAIPSSFIQLSSIILNPSESVMKSLFDNIAVIHSLGGGIIGLSMLALTSFLVASFISIISIISADFYESMESGSDPDDSSKIRLLGIIALILFSIFFFKKIFL